ncbi:MAG TPA: hypothetical protein VK894_04905 [Jiangellales bacterium]|nr:hypothetical protein [Jiangellales bacterium]
MRTVLSRAPWLRRWWWLLLAGPLLASLVAVMAGPSPTTWSSRTLVVVEAGEGADSPGSSFEAGALAATYARLLPEDDQLTAYLASATGTDVATVQAGLLVAQVQGTALLEITLTMPDEASATAAGEAVRTAMTAEPAVSETFSPDALRVVRSGQVEASEGYSLSVLVLVASLLGLLVAGGVVLVAERSDRRVDDADTASELLLCPVHEMDLSGGTAITSLAVLERWAGRDPGSPGSHRVVIVPAGKGAARLAESLAEWHRGSTGEVRAVIRPDVPGPDHDRLMAADLVAVALVEGVRLPEVTRTARTLVALGRAPAVGILLRGVPGRMTGGGVSGGGVAGRALARAQGWSAQRHREARSVTDDR